MIKSLIDKYLNFCSAKVVGRKILFLSDDWGSERLRSESHRDDLIRAGLDMTTNRFDRFDCYESDTDLEYLFEILQKHRNINGKHPVINAVSCMANPDYQKIFDSDYNEYFYEESEETAKRYKNTERLRYLYKYGFENELFIPQLHGREHLNVARWLRALREEDPATTSAFKNKYYYVPVHNLPDKFKKGYGSAFDIDLPEEIDIHRKILEDSVNLFHNKFGFCPSLFVPPSLVFYSGAEKVLSNLGVKYIDTPKLQLMPFGNNVYKRRLNYTGKKCNGLNYIVRNAVFDTDENSNEDIIDNCLKKIEKAFKHKMPAIISNHRSSFVGGISISNRDTGLVKLNSLLSRIYKNWPDVDFVQLNKDSIL